MPRLIDSHCHLHFPPYDADRADVLQRMKDEDVWAITVGTTIGTSKGAIELAEKTEDVWATVGYHPEHFTSSFHDASEGDADTYSVEDIRKLATSSKKVVAIGETGLDFYRIDEDRNIEDAKKTQERGFREHIALAHDLDLPLAIHCRNALTRLAEVVRDEKAQGKNIRGVVHCFTGSWDEAKPLLDLGLHLSFTGVITFPPKKTDDPTLHVHRVIERMPLDRILIETDAPWLTPIPYRGKRNEPAYVRYVAEQIAKLRDVSVEHIASHSTQNALILFRISRSCV